MKNLIIDDTFLKNNKVININEDCLVYLVSNNLDKEIKIKVNDCNIEIIDRTSANKKIYLNNSNLKYFLIPLNKMNNSLYFINQNSNLDLEIIDIINQNNNLNIKVDLAKENSNVKINSAILSFKDYKKEYFLNPCGLVSKTSSDVNNFGIVKDSAFINFSVNSLIENKAKESSAFQKSHILLLDKGASGINVPILTIKENEVKAGHGATIGYIDEEALFYLTSRGILFKEARTLIILGKISFMLNKLSDKLLQEELISYIIKGVN